MHHNDIIETVVNELALYGLKPAIHDRGKHQAIVWQLPHCPVRTYIVAKTPSDWRARLNARADVRRLLRADKAQLAPAKVITLQRAFSLPPKTPSEHPNLRIAKLESDIEGLMDVAIELQEQLKTLEAKLGNARVVATLMFDAPTTVPVVTPVPAPVATGERAARGTLQAKLNEVMPPGRWMAVKDLSKSVYGDHSPQSQSRVSQLLKAARDKGLVENGQRGWWRRLPENQQQSSG